MRRARRTPWQVERRKHTPEEQLMLAVLEQALADLDSHCPAVAADAEAYFLAYKPDTTPFSFECICQHFQLPASAIRQEVKRRLRGRAARHAA